MGRFVLSAMLVVSVCSLFYSVVLMAGTSPEAAVNWTIAFGVVCVCKMVFDVVRCSKAGKS